MGCTKYITGYHGASHPSPLTFALPLLLLTLFVLFVSWSGISCPSWIMYFQRSYQLGWWAQLCPVVHLSRKGMELAVCSIRQPLSSDRGQPHSIPLPNFWHLYLATPALFFFFSIVKQQSILKLIEDLFSSGSLVVCDQAIQAVET